MYDKPFKFRKLNLELHVHVMHSCAIIKLIYTVIFCRKKKKLTATQLIPIFLKLMTKQTIFIMKHVCDVSIIIMFIHY